MTSLTGVGSAGRGGSGVRQGRSGAGEEEEGQGQEAGSPPGPAAAQAAGPY